jgi:sulfate adenylyltransferase subunit 2
VPSIYFSHRRACVRRGGQWLPVTDTRPAAQARSEEVRELKPTEALKTMVVRVRTIGDIISTGMVESPPTSVDDIIAEVAAARVTERGSRADDKASEAAMEDRKKAGYF